ncbi:hypothetical protein Scep_021616 [Stephania cephalantha]|uniref:DUF4218 domain-containing protein n=1 Tax=Stephania cephalantha TaxID=152367 RepID=A0AAP0I0D4_9MAGN
MSCTHEKNVFDNIFNTIMCVPGKSKDNAKARQDIREYCHRPSLHIDSATNTYILGCYALDTSKKQKLCEWVEKLRFPDGYASNLGRCVDPKKLRMFGMKSHDCHIFMQRLIPIAFRELLPNPVWVALSELSLFFRSLTAKSVSLKDMEVLESEIPKIICKLEKIFPPSFFDSMEHLPIHLAYEARPAVRSISMDVSI